MEKPILLVEDNPMDVDLTSRAFERNKVDGLEVLRQLKAHPVFRRLPVVVLTTSAEDRGDLAQVAAQIDLYWTLLNLPPALGAAQ